MLSQKAPGVAGSFIADADCGPLSRSSWIVDGDALTVETAALAFIGDLTVRVPASASQAIRDFEEEQVYFVDSTFTDIFPLDFVYGDPAQRLAAPYTVLLSKEVAACYFGDANPVGQSIIAEGEYVFTVTGVVKDFPRNTHLHFSMLMPYDNMFDVQASRLRPSSAKTWRSTGSSPTRLPTSSSSLAPHRAASSSSLTT